MTEVWKPVVRFEGRYEVSSEGRVRSIARLAPRRGQKPMPVPERIVAPAKAKRGGYPMVQLHLNGQRFPRTIHSLVAEAFIGPRPARLDVCHEDGDETNCRESNLRYGTRLSNVADTIRHGRKPIGSKSHYAKLTEDQAKEVKASSPKDNPSATMARRLGISAATIRDIRAGRSWKHLP